MTNPYFMPENAVIKQRILERKRVGDRYTIPAYVLQSAQFNVTEYTAEQLLMSVIAEVLSEHIVGETQTVALDVPSSWWQVFKETYRESRLFGWFVRRYPVRSHTMKKTVTFNRYHNYPDAKIALPEKQFGRHVIYETTSFGEWSIGDSSL